jgi:hypothetical protein
MPAPDLTNMTNLFVALRDQFHEKIFTHYWQTDPYVSLIPKKFYDPREGILPTVLTPTYELPLDYPTAMATLARSTGTGSSCDVDPTEVEFGHDERTFGLKVDAWRSPAICLTDLQFDHNPLAFIRNVEEGLMQYAITKNADWNRYHATGMVDNKATIKGSDDIAEDENSSFDFDDIILTRQNTAQAGAATTITLDAGASAVDDTYNNLQIHIISGTGSGQSNLITDYVGSTKVATVQTAWTTNPDATSVFRILTADIPTSTLEWSNLEYFYNELARKGADRYAVGYADGQRVYAVTLGAEAKANLFLDNLNYREDIRYAMPMENFRARGIDRAVNGFMPNVDLFPIRFDAAGQRIYPWVSAASSGTGKKYSANPNYKPVSKGGKALYETANILTTEVFECQPRPIGQIQFSKAKFQAINYTAELNWINNPDNGDNPLGNKGYFRADWQLAAMPKRPEMGYTILHKIASEV